MGGVNPGLNPGFGVHGPRPGSVYYSVYKLAFLNFVKIPFQYCSISTVPYRSIWRLREPGPEMWAENFASKMWVSEPKQVLYRYAVPAPTLIYSACSGSLKILRNESVYCFLVHAEITD
jgi:hypothetical protein